MYMYVYIYSQRGLNVIFTVIFYSDEDGGAHCSMDRWKEMLRPETRRPLGVILPSFFLLHWGGMSSIRPYMVHVFQEFGLGEASSWTTVRTYSYLGAIH